MLAAVTGAPDSNGAFAACKRVGTGNRRGNFKGGDSCSCGQSQVVAAGFDRHSRQTAFKLIVIQYAITIRNCSAILAAVPSHGNGLGLVGSFSSEARYLKVFN